MNPYQVRQVDADGQVLGETQVVAQNYNSALRELEDVYNETKRIEVFNHEGERAGEIGVDYWRQKLRRR